MSSIPVSPNQLIWGGDLFLEERSDHLLPPIFDADYLIYECVSNTNAYQVGWFLRSQFLVTIGWSVVDRHPVYNGKNLLIPDTGFSSQFRLNFIPYNNRSFPAFLTLKIWKSTMPLSRSGDVQVTPQTSQTAIPYMVASSTEQVTLIESNNSRVGATIWNSSTSVLYIDLGNSVANNDYTVKLGSNDYYEIPFGYTGIIVGVWAEANGSAMVRELT